MTQSASNFLVIGERTNITGSPKFAKALKAGDWDACLAIAKQQVESGANIIDINVDEALIEGESTMVKFLNLIAAEPDICRVPVMVDSSKWTVLEAGLQLPHSAVHLPVQQPPILQDPGAYGLTKSIPIP